MAEESAIVPLAPARIHHRSDEEFALEKTQKSHQKKPGKCFVYTLTFFVVQAFILLVFSLIFLRVSPPEVNLRTVEFRNLRFNNTASQAPLLNVTMNAQVSIENNNFGRFNFEKFNTVILYGNVTFGDVEIHSGRVKARATERVNITVTVRSNSGVFGNKNLSSEMSTGLLELRSFAKLKGRVHVMKIVSKHKSPELNCTMSLNLTSQVFQNLECM